MLLLCALLILQPQVFIILVPERPKNIVRSTRVEAAGVYILRRYEKSVVFFIQHQNFGSFCKQDSRVYRASKSQAGWSIEVQ